MRCIFVCGLGWLILLSGCITPCKCGSPPPVAQTYTHKYGQVLSEKDWRDKGSYGTITSRLPNGVTRIETFEQGVLHGECSETFPFNQAIALRQVYERGQKAQEVGYSTGGAPLQKQEWRGDQRIATTWYPDGSPMAVESYEQDRLISGEYFNREHELEAQVLEGKGYRICRDTQGKILAQEEISSGEVCLHTEYFDSGIPSKVTPFFRGAIHGLVATYLPDGQPSSTEHYHLGKRHGLTTLFLNGDRAQEVPYVHGKKEGVEKHYEDGHSVVRTVAWREDLQHGPTETLLPEARSIEYWYRGALVPKLTYERQVSKERARHR